MAGTDSDRRVAIAIAAVLVLANLVIYAQTFGFGFVNYDDEKYILKNPVVQSGLRPASIAWSFTSFLGSHWHPLTWLSHMLDCQLFGLNAGGHHATSVAIHAATTLLLFFLLVRLTGAVWLNGFLVGFFSLHPLRVESVAWIAERKDVLSALFFVLTLWAYVLYTERPAVGRFAALLAVFAAGLLAKPMLVTLPFVLLLLDIWPLGRLPSARPRPRGATSGVPVSRLLGEKAPLLAMAIAASAVAVASQRFEGSLRSFESLPWDARLANGIFAYGNYLVMTVWPRGLAVFYPFETPLAAWKVGASLAVLTAVSALALRSARRRPALVTGWLWYLGVLVPVIGLVQVGGQAYADRYTYLPSIGLLVALLHGAVGPWLERRPAARVPMGAIGALAMLALVLAARTQAGYWRDSVTLFEHTLATTRSNAIAHYNLGCALANAGRNEEAIPHYLEAVRIRPDYAPPHHNIGLSVLATGRTDDAIVHFRKAVQLDPGYGDARLNLGVTLGMKGRLDEAAANLTEAARLLPDDPLAPYNLGLTQQQLGRLDDAIASYTRALAIDPSHIDSRFVLATALAAKGRTEEAATQIRRVLELKPDYPGAAEELRKLK